MKTIELGHAVLYVRDLERSRHFYGEVLGLPEDTGPPSRVPPRSAVVAPTTSCCSSRSVRRRRPRRRAGAPASTTSGSRSAPPTTSCARRSRSCRTPGSPSVGASDHTVTHSLYIEDPDGNELELYIDVQPEEWRDDPALVMAPTKPLRI